MRLRGTNGLSFHPPAFFSPLFLPQPPFCLFVCLQRRSSDNGSSSLNVRHSITAVGVDHAWPPPVRTYTKPFSSPPFFSSSPSCNLSSSSCHILVRFSCSTQVLPSLSRPLTNSRLFSHSRHPLLMGYLHLFVSKSCPVLTVCLSTPCLVLPCPSVIRFLRLSLLFLTPNNCVFLIPGFLFFCFLFSFPIVIVLPLQVYEYSRQLGVQGEMFLSSSSLVSCFSFGFARCICIYAARLSCKFV